MSTEKMISGPFGQYPINSFGGVLNTLVRIYHVPLHIAESVTIGMVDENEVGKIFYNNNEVAHYKVYPGLKHPILRFIDPEWRIYAEHTFVDMGGDKLKMLPVITLGINGYPVFDIRGDKASEDVYSFLNDTMMTNQTDHGLYVIKKASGAFFQAGYSEPLGKCFIIEFSGNGEDIQKWFEYIKTQTLSINGEVNDPI